MKSMAAAWIFALISLMPIIVLKVILGHVLEGKIGMFIKIGVGLGATIAAAAVSSFCPALGLYLVLVAIIMGELFGAIGAFLGPHIPWIGVSISAAIDPISGVIWWLLVLSIVLTVLHILSIFSLIPVINIIIMIANIAIPLIMLWLVWGAYVDAVKVIPACFGLGGGPTEIPLTGGVKIGTYT